MTAAQAGTKLQIAVYGGSALMLASNFRFATEDVDVSKLDHPLPDWLATVVHEIAEKNHWQEDWFNDGVTFHLSPLADRARRSSRVRFVSAPMARRWDLWFRSPRRNICWRSTKLDHGPRFAARPSG